MTGCPARAPSAGRVNIEDARTDLRGLRSQVCSGEIVFDNPRSIYAGLLEPIRQRRLSPATNWWNLTQAGTGLRGPAGTDAYSSRVTATREEPAQGTQQQFRIVDVSPGIQNFTFRTLGAEDHALAVSILSGTKIQVAGQVFTTSAPAATFVDEVAIRGSWDTEPTFTNGTGYAILFTQARSGAEGARGIPGLDGSGTALTDAEAIDPDDETNTGTVTGDQLDKAIQANSPFTPERQSFLSDLGNFIVQHPDHNLRLEVTLHSSDFFGNDTGGFTPSPTMTPPCTRSARTALSTKITVEFCW